MPRTGMYAKGSLRREEILHVAFDELALNGYRKTSLRQIAQRVNVEPARVLYYFGSREKLLQEVVERWDAQAQARFGELATPGASSPNLA